MQRMRRTQIYLQPDLSAALDRLARERGTSRAALIRLAARRFVDQEQEGAEDPILELIGIGRGGPGRVSEEHDQFLVRQSLESRTE